MSPDNVVLPLSTLSKVLQVEKSFPTSSAITVGDVLEALVLRNLDEGKLLIRLGGSETMQAESTVTLRAGDSVFVKVEQLRPSLVLSLVDQKLVETEKVMEFLRLQRANPGALPNAIVELSERLETPAFAPLLSLLNQANLKTLRGLLATLSLSKATGQDKQFIQNYISNLGLTWESNLKKALIESNVDFTKSSLKAALMALAEEIRADANSIGFLKAEAFAGLKALEQLASSAVKTIESEQVLNVVSLENDNRYLLQIPLQLPTGHRTADLCIEFEQKTNEGKNGGKFRVLFLLDMDALGDLAVEASIQDKLLSCHIQCTQMDAYSFVAQSLPDLKQRLGGLGYRLESVDCRLEKDVEPVREEFKRYRSLGGRDAVNIFI